VLKAAALAGAVTLTNSSLASAHSGGRADVIVIGAGFAGVTAARELRAAGLRPVLIEARDRIGGRTWTDTFGGETIEYGGTWFGDFHTRSLAELQRYGIGLTNGGIVPARSFYPTANGPVEFDFATANDHLGTLMSRLFDGSRDYFPRPLEPLHRADLLARVDPLSLRDGLRGLNLSTQDELWLSGTTSVFSGGSSTTGGLAAMAHWWALCGWTPQGWGAQLAYRAEGGTGALLNAMLADAQADLHLSSPVKSVTDDGRRVHVVTTSGAHYTAPAVVVAVPVNLWQTIHFAPGLPHVHRTATTQGIGVPNAGKALIRLTGERIHPTGFGTEGSAFHWVSPLAEYPDGDQLVVAFTVDPRVDLTSRDSIQNALNTVIPGVRVRDFRAHSWARDPYSRGGWALRRPGQLLRLYPEILRPSGRVVFASADIATGWHGYIDGAIESGFRAADQVLSKV
jgi:monoamine oxidase